MALGRIWQLQASLIFFCGLSVASFRGKKFLTAFPQNDEAGTSPQLQLLLLAHSNSTQVTVTIRGATVATVAMEQGDTYRVAVPSHMELAGNHLASKAILVEATKEISVTTINSKSYTVGASGVLPVEKLGSKYYVVTPVGVTEGHKELVVVAGKSSTTISMKVTGKFSYQGRTYPPGATFKIFLEPYHSFQLQSLDDLSGTEVTADKAVAVLSGHTCVKVNTGCDYVVEQLLPVEAWGDTYIIPPNPYQSNVDMAYVVAAEKTMVTYNHGVETTSKALEAGEVLKVDIKPKSPLQVKASAPVQVVLFFTGVKDHYAQDPFLLTIPPVSTYCTSYQVAGFGWYVEEMILIAPTVATNGINLNQKTSWQEIPGSEYSWSSISMRQQEKSQSVEHQESPFGLLMFGYSTYAGYGFPGHCATPSSPPSCEDLNCPERCELLDGQPTCLPETFSTCWLANSRHYHTFDGKDFDFVGTCSYILSTSCSTSEVTTFSVVARNQDGGNSRASNLHSVVVHVYDFTIVAVKGEKGIVRVNHQRSYLPISLANGKLYLQQKGKSFHLQTNFQLHLFYDWEDHVVLKVASKLSQHLCGLCGNANGDPWDDFAMANGELAEDIMELVQSWKGTNESHCCSDGCVGDCGGRCRGDQMAKYKKKTSCGLLSHRLGPFRHCHSTLDPNIYLKNCVHDLCLTNGLQATLCQALQAYADDCQEEGVVLADWRTLARCPLSCPANSFYTSCGSSCPSTCNDEALPAACNSSSCVESCQCLEGFVLHANQCVPKAQCGCVFGDLLHGHQEDFWGDETCSSKCFCGGEGQGAQCQGSTCQLGEECRVEEGLQGCHPKAYGTCVAFGTTHYQTFDGKSFIFQGSCVYQMVGLCKESQELVDFQVLVQNEGQGQELLGSIAAVTLKVYNKTIVISQENPNRIMINHHLTNLPYHQPDGKLSITRGGLEAVVELDFGLKLTYDWQSQITISIPSTYSTSLCGLCGNFNGDLTDEMMTKEGSITSNPDLLGHSWKVKELPGCGEHSMVECPPRLVTRWPQVTSKKQCQLLLQQDGPFGACHHQIDPKSYFHSCMHDACLFPGREDVLCPIFARYAAACRAAAVVVGLWRTDVFCGISCPPRSHYDLCSQTCSQSCSNLVQLHPKCPRRCQEGCSCDQGLVLSGDQCVPASQCGCVHQGFYYKLEEVFFSTTTTSTSSSSTVEKCQCQAGGTLSCEVLTCPGGTKGEVLDGVFQCPTEAPGLCVLTGDHNLRTFDGMAFNISATCSYVLAETCGGHHGGEKEEVVTPFVVKIKKVARQKKKISGIQEVTVEVYGLTVTLRRGKRGEVMVDSISHHLPTSLSRGRVHLYPHGLGVLLQTNSGLLLYYDLMQQVTLQVPPTYQGHLCGLCGNFNGEQGDELLLPGGQVAPNLILFASSWRTSPEPCSQDCPKELCPPCSEEKKLVLQKTKYCGIILDPKGPLAACHQVLEPTWFFQACLQDLCQAEGDTQVLCSSVQSYVTACQEAKVLLKEWRRPSFCPLSCPANSTYSLCTNHCHQSCPSLRDATTKCPKSCLEGCACLEGHVFDGSRCLPEDQCGCWVDGIYYQPYEVVLKDNCHQRCTCVPAEGLRCESHSCTEDESCDIREGHLSCINQNPCKALGCRSRERCELRGDHATCVPTHVATCWAWGDPHYRTFDGFHFDFQGTCTYTMAESCGPDPNLQHFQVQGKNDIRGGVKSVSYLSVATVKVYGQEISIRRKESSKVRVNGVLTLLPVTLADGKLQIFQSGLQAVVELDFGLRVTYDWNWHLQVDLPSSYYKHTCGLCGNYNLQAHDDVPQGATDLATLVAWAEGWKVIHEEDEDGGGEEDLFCWDYCDGNCPVCEEEKKELYGGHHYCGLLKKTFQGPFRACHEVLKPQEFYRNCLYDVCMSGGARSILCQVLETYATSCLKRGVPLEDWRTPSGCPLPCPPHSHYEACGAACPATCSNPEAPNTCTLPCVETCACDPGYVLSGARCVHLSSCGCSHAGHYYQAGEEFWGDQSCTSRCRCHPDLAMVLCEDAACQAGEECRVVRGVRRCVATKALACVATGDPHYTTFDGRRYDFMGTCGYQLAALCSNHSTLVPFAVVVQNEHRGTREVSYTKEVILKVYNMTLSFSREHPQKLKVNDIVLDLPYQHEAKLQAFQRGFHGFIHTNFDLQLSFDWLSHVHLQLPTTYSTSVCGLCGNANGDPEDDFSMPDGHQATSELQLGDSWKVEEMPGCWAGCEGQCRTCSELEKKVYRGDKHCGLLLKKRGPFSSCHQLVDPKPYFEDCLFDACHYEGHQESVCSILSSYVTACQSLGVTIKKWRTSSFCSPVCPANQHYELQGPPCPSTCRDQAEAEPCDPNTTPSLEGCFCDAGFLRSGDLCVPLAQCGCWYQGSYYQAGEDFIPCPKCTQRCSCQGGGLVKCHHERCQQEEECAVKDGVRGCYPRACGRCQLLGTMSYRTFDGQEVHFAGTCTYTLVEVVAEGPEEGLVPLLVEVEKESGGEEKGGARVRRLLVTIYGLTVSLERGKQWEVMVDGEKHLLPVSLADGSLSVSQEGNHRVLLAQSGLKILYDGATYVVVTLPSTYSHHTRGICGDFDDDATNDLTSPAELGEAWGTMNPTCSHGSPPPPCPKVTNGPCDVLLDPKGPFSECHKVVEAQEHLAACLQEQCVQPGGDSLCRSLQGYAAACQAAGGQLHEWREVTKCPMSCPADSTYQLCSHTCAQSCASLSSSLPCSAKCFEGCACAQGLLFDGHHCVPMDACGCFHRGRYFQIASSITSPDCSQRCSCNGPGATQCQATSCPFGQSCGLLHGARTCVDQPGRCTLDPASRLVTFDGVTGLTTPTGVYVLTSVCDHQGAPWFRLLVEVGEVEARPAVVALHLFHQGPFVTVTRDKKVWVNGVASKLPVNISNTLSIKETKGSLWLTQSLQLLTQNPQLLTQGQLLTQSGQLLTQGGQLLTQGGHLLVVLSPRGEVTVQVAKELSQQLCGLCGDYDGEATNDLRGADGMLVANVATMIKAWRAPDFYQC